MWHWRSSRTWVIGIALAALVACCVLPLAFLVVELLRHPADAFGALRLDARRRGLLFNTALLGIGTAGVATAIGVPLGILLARAGLRRTVHLRLLLAVPALIPPYTSALAWTYFGGLAHWTYTLPAAILVLSLVFYPLSMLATEVALGRIDGRLEEAGLLASPPGTVLRRITLPLGGPSILAAALLTFVLAVSEFGVPGLLRVRVYTTEVFTAFAALYDISSAIALTIPLLMLCVCVAGAAAVLAGDRLTHRRVTSAGSPALFDRWRRPALVFAFAIIALAVGMPVLALWREAMRVQSAREILAGSGGAMRNSLVLAALGATLVVILALPLGYARARSGRGMGRAADVALVVLFAVPSTVVGVALIGLWNRPGMLGTVYGTQTMFVIAYMARLLPVGTLMLGATARSVPVSHEEAGAVAGAGWLRTATRIVLPQMRVGLAIAWTIVFVMAFGELGASILIAPPGDATLPIRIYTLIANAPSSQVAAFALLQTTVVLAGVAAIAAIAALSEAA
jgi:iron(III) transport system permease protein